VDVRILDSSHSPREVLKEGEGWNVRTGCNVGGAQKRGEGGKKIGRTKRALLRDAAKGDGRGGGQLTTDRDPSCNQLDRKKPALSTSKNAFEKGERRGKRLQMGV